MAELRIEGVADQTLDALRTEAGTRGLTLEAFVSELLRERADAFVRLLDGFDTLAAATEAGDLDSMAILRAMRGDPDFLLPSNSTDLIRIMRDGGMDEVLREARGNRAA